MVLWVRIKSGGREKAIDDSSSGVVLGFIYMVSSESHDMMGLRAEFGVEHSEPTRLTGSLAITVRPSTSPRV